MLHALRQRLADVRTVRRLLTTAEAAARSEGESRPGAEHLLLAAMSLPDGTAARALARCGAAPDDLARAVADQHAAALAGLGLAADEARLSASLPPAPPPRGPYDSTASAQALFQRTTELARAGRRALRGAHVVLAATEVEHGTVARALQHLSVDRALLAAAARAELDGGAARRPAA